MNSFRLDGLGLAIRQAIASGNVARREREQKRREEEEAKARELSAQSESCLQEVLSALPNAITIAVASATKMPVRCIVMFVAPREYMLNVYYDYRYCSVVPEADTVDLRGSAAQVFAELQRLGYSPTLEFDFSCDGNCFDSDSGLRQRLCICISVQ